MLSPAQAMAAQPMTSTVHGQISPSPDETMAS